MKKLAIKKRFHVKQRTPDTRKIISLHVSAQLDETVTNAAQNLEVTKQDLIRQMITHCLNDLGYDAPENTDSPPPKKRVYKKRVPKKRVHKKKIKKRVHRLLPPGYVGGLVP